MARGAFYLRRGLLRPPEPLPHLLFHVFINHTAGLLSNLPPPPARSPPAAPPPAARARRRVPSAASAASDAPAVDAICCSSCHDAEPEETMLLCDGCEVAYHMECLRPAMEEVPAGDWYCHGCARQLKGSRLGQDDAMR